MGNEDLQNEAPQDGQDVGQVLVSWETWEFPPVERSTQWYVTSSAVGLGMLIYALLTANFVFALIIVMFAVILLMKDLKQPARVPVVITTEGIVFNNEFYSYNDIQDFTIIYEPPEVNNLYIGFTSRFSPDLSIHLDSTDPNTVRSSLLPFVFENLNRDSESLTDTLSRVYKL